MGGPTASMPSAVESVESGAGFLPFEMERSVGRSTRAARLHTYELMSYHGKRPPRGAARMIFYDWEIQPVRTDTKP